jgi:hypothetical protein
MGGLEKALFDTNLQDFTNEVVASVRDDVTSDNHILREKVADGIQAMMRKEYPGKSVGISTCIHWKGVQSTFEVNAVIEHDGAKYVTTVYAELSPAPESKSQTLAEVLEGIVSKVFAKLTGDASLTLHQLVLKSEEEIRRELVAHYDGLEEDFEVNVTGGVGKDLSFRVNVEDVRVGMVVEASIEYKRYEEQEHPMQPTVKESIDPAPISKAQRGRSEKTLVLTMAANRAFTDAFLAHEQDRTAVEFADNIKLAVLKQLGEEFPADDYSVRTECTEDMVATVWVEAPGVTKIRLRGHRATQSTQQV